MDAQNYMKCSLDKYEVTYMFYDFTNTVIFNMILLLQCIVFVLLLETGALSQRSGILLHSVARTTITRLLLFFCFFSSSSIFCFMIQV